MAMQLRQLSLPKKTGQETETQTTKGEKMNRISRVLELAELLNKAKEQVRKYEEELNNYVQGNHVGQGQRTREMWAKKTEAQRRQWRRNIGRGIRRACRLRRKLVSVVTEIPQSTTSTTQQ